MSLIEETVQKEKSRIEFMLSEYETRLQVLPKGTISASHSGEKTYYYLKFREGKKIVSQYITSAEKEKLEPAISERRHVEAMIKSLFFLENSISQSSFIIKYFVGNPQLHQ